MDPHRREELVLRARSLRSNPTDAERALWRRICRRQLGVRFLRQRLIGPYIVDFVAPAIRLTVEVDGSQHTEAPQRAYDSRRDAWFAHQGFETLRFDARAALLETEAVAMMLFRAVAERLAHPPASAPRTRPPSAGRGWDPAPFQRKGAACATGGGCRNGPRRDSLILLP